MVKVAEVRETVRGALFAPGDEESKARIDAERLDVIRWSAAEYDARLPHTKVFDAAESLVNGPREEAHVHPRESQRTAIVGSVSRKWRIAGRVLFGLNSLVATYAYTDITQIDDNIIEAVEESGLPELDAEIEGMTAAQAAVHLAQEEQRDRIELATDHVEDRLSDISEDAQRSGRFLYQAGLGISVYGLGKAAAKLAGWYRKRRDQKDTYTLKYRTSRRHRELSVNSPTDAQTLLQAAPRGHVTKLGPDDKSKVMTVETRRFTREDEPWINFGRRFYRGFGGFLAGGMLLMSPVTHEAADQADEVIEAVAPDGLQDVTTWLGRGAIRFQQERIEDSVQVATEDMLPNTTELTGGDLSPVFQVASAQVDEQVDQTLAAITNRPPEYAPVSANVKALSNLYSSAFGGNLFDADPEVRRVLLGVAGVGWLFMRMADGKPLFATRREEIYITKNALEQAITAGGNDWRDTDDLRPQTWRVYDRVRRGLDGRGARHWSDKLYDDLYALGRAPHASDIYDQARRRMGDTAHDEPDDRPPTEEA